MYIMFKPDLPFSCYVPLQIVRWGWVGTTEFNLLHASWTLKSSNSFTTGKGEDTNVPPNWSSITQ
jgi:hypothetical protein